MIAAFQEDACHNPECIEINLRGGMKTDKQAKQHKDFFL
jgi:hypothetical protein